MKMIDIDKEEPLSLTDAARSLPSIDGKRPHASTLWRWCRKGLRGVRLEYLRLGRRIVTTQQALARFMQRLAEMDQEDIVSSTNPSEKVNNACGEGKAARQRALERAEQQLRKAGI